MADDGRASPALSTSSTSEGKARRVLNVVKSTAATAVAKLPIHAEVSGYSVKPTGKSYKSNLKSKIAANEKTVATLVRDVSNRELALRTAKKELEEKVRDGVGDRG